VAAFGCATGASSGYTAATNFFSLNESFHVALFDFEDTRQADWAVAIWKSSQILETYTLEQTRLERTTDLSA
jgi:hypothetical protein